MFTLRDTCVTASRPGWLREVALWWASLGEAPHLGPEPASHTVSPACPSGSERAGEGVQRHPGSVTGGARVLGRDLCGAVTS